jgi:hypothetical protein
MTAEPLERLVSSLWGPGGGRLKSLQFPREENPGTGPARMPKKMMAGPNMRRFSSMCRHDNRLLRDIVKNFGEYCPFSLEKILATLIQSHLSVSV